jgi:acyl-CoA synthetase (AMP-forming)/AMP-acid ligase II
MPTLVEMLRYRATTQPGQQTFTFFDNGVDESAALSLGALDARARSIASRLTSSAPAGSRVMLSYNPGLEFIAAFFGCVYAGMIAVPVSPISGDRTEIRRTRLDAVCDSAGPVFFLSDAASLAKVEPLLRENPKLATLTTVATDEVDPAGADAWTPPKITPETVAYLQYSSGSTGVPKGVMLTHHNVVSNLELVMNNCDRPGETDGQVPPMVSWLPMFHDMGLVSAVLEPIFAGYDAVLMSAMTFVQRPVTWLRQITRLGEASSAAPNFAFDLCVRRITDKQLGELDLSGWQLAMVGAEPVRADTLDRFTERFAAAGFDRAMFLPSYGLAESTVMVTGGPFRTGPLVHCFDTAALTKGRVQLAPEPEAGRDLIASGQVHPSVTVLIAEPGSDRQCVADEVGEILVSGPSVGLGYWNAPEVSAKTFGARMPGHGDASFLRTGDLGFLDDGQLFVTGRVKDVIIVDGANHYPQDIELTVAAAHPAVRDGFVAAFSTDDGQRERLIVLAELNGRYRLRDGATTPPPGGRQRVDPGEVSDAIRAAVTAAHGIAPADIVLLKTGALPFTSSGKLQRAQCRARYCEDQWTGSVLPATQNEGR